jgi:phage protein D
MSSAGDLGMSALGLAGDRHDTTFYAPEYCVKVAGQQLYEKGSDFLSVQIKDSIKDLSTFELTLNNWDDGGDGGKPGFKYTEDEDTITLGQQVELQMGYADAPALTEMMTGEITAMDPQFPSAGAPTITIRGLDRLHRMRNRPKSFAWKGKTDKQIAQKIAAQNGLGFQGDDTGPSQPLVPQDNMDDIAFLLERAKRINFEVFVKDDVLYFVKCREGQDPVLTLEWGTSLMSFSPSLTLSKQVSKVTVRSWHPSEGRLIQKTAERSKLSDISSGGKNAGQVLDEAIGESKEEIITSEAVLSDEDAQLLAESVLKRSSYAFITGNAQTVGIPSLRAGVNVKLTGLGKRFDGPYYVTESTHKIDGSGYTTSFSVRKVYA